MATDVNESAESIGSGESVQKCIADLIASVDDSGAVAIEAATLEQLQAALDVQGYSPQNRFTDENTDGRAESHAQDASQADLDRNFAQWQAKIMLALDEDLRNQLSEQFSKAEQLSDQLAETLSKLSTRQHELDDKALSVETRLSKALLKEAETSRVRKSVAKQLRAQKATVLAEIAQARQQQLDELNEIARQNASAELSSLEQALQRESAERERLQKEYEQSVESLAQANSDCDDANKRVAEESRKLEEQSAELRDLRQNAEEAQAKLQAAEKLVEEKSHELDELSSKLGDRDDSFTALERDLAEAKAERDDLQERLDRQLSDIESEKSGVDSVREDLEKANKQLAESQAELTVASQKIDALNSQNEEKDQNIAELQTQLEASAGGNDTDTAEQLRELQDANDVLKDELEQQRKSHEEELDSENARLIQQLSSLQQELESKQQELEQIADLAAASDGETSQQAEQLKVELSDARKALDEANASHQNEVDAMREQLSETLETITLLREQHEAMRSQEVDADNLSKADAEQFKQLEARQQELSNKLEETLDEVDRLRIENAQLNEQVENGAVPGTRPHVNFNQESLSWEERKKLIMDQLEHDDLGGEVDQEAKLEISSIVETTQAEIERRDREIEELRTIVEQQSDTKQGVAIGAAAIAQMFESDELIVEEREKLKGIQAEWEEKVRQAEIDISMERAKLARERSQIETKVQELESRLAELPQQAAPTTEGRPQVRTRKWLDHLGLREDKDT